MFSILNRALSWAVTTFGNKFCLRMRSRLIKALNIRFCVKFMQLEIGLLTGGQKPSKSSAPCIMSMQYTGGCAVQWGMFSTLGDIMSTLGDVQYTGGYHEYTGG